MNLLITNKELNSFKSRDLIPLKCENCRIVFYKGKNIVQTSLKGNPNFALRFCSLKCHYIYQKKMNWTTLKCEECKIDVIKQRSKITNNKYNFCSKSCSATFQNRNKTLNNFRRSKSEKLLIDLINKNFQNLIVEENVRDFLPSNLELDIFIPQIMLAIEVNGPTHFLPIFGIEKLRKIKEKDAQKILYAEKLKCKLIIIDISTIKYWKETKKIINEEFYTKIKFLIANELKLTGRQGFEPR